MHPHRFPHPHTLTKTMAMGASGFGASLKPGCSMRLVVGAAKARPDSRFGMTSISIMGCEKSSDTTCWPRLRKLTAPGCFVTMGLTASHAISVRMICPPRPA